MAKATRFTQEMIEQYSKKGYWETITLSDLWNKNAREIPDKEAIVDSKNRLSWKQANVYLDRLALALLELGFKKDDLLVIQLPNSIELVLLRIACERAGLLHMPLLRTLRHKELEYILKFTEAPGIAIPWEFRGFNYYQMIQEIHSNTPSLKHIFIYGEPVPEGTLSLTKIYKTALENKYPAEYLESKKCSAFEFSLVSMTTGTTGFPKFVEQPICSRLYSGRALVKDMLIPDENNAVLSPAPGGPNHLAYFGIPYVGAKIVMMEHFEAEECLKLIEKERITTMGLVPAQLGMIIGHPALNKYNIRSLRYIMCVGDFLPYQLGLEAEAKLGCPIVQAYGATDFGNVTQQTPFASPQVRFLTVGKPIEGNEIRLIDDQGRDVKQGEVGEVVARGPATVSGFYKDPEATYKAWDKEGWFRLGDLGKFDEEGNLLLVGRKKDIIIRGGQNIYPAEIEDLLVTHPGVSNVAIVGMPDSIMGERACAYVQPKPGLPFTFEDMLSFLKEKKIAPYKLPERLEIVDKLPMVAEGQKVDKKVLRQDIFQKLEKEQRRKP